MKMNPRHMVNNMSSKFKNDGFEMLAIAISILLFFIFILSLLYGQKEEKRKTNNTNATKNSEKPTEIGSIGSSSHRTAPPIRDYYIKSSFNSCAGGIGQKDWVGLKPLEHVIKRGVRMLDFEIVSKNGEPFICTSPETISNLKTAMCGTYNTLSFKEVMNFCSIKRICRCR